MIPRHSNEVLSRLDRVYDIGCAEIRNHELLMWYGKERLTVSIWRDLADKWAEILEQNGHDLVPLFVGESDGVWVFIWGAGLATDDTWLKDLQTLLRRPEDFSFEK